MVSSRRVAVLFGVCVVMGVAASSLCAQGPRAGYTASEAPTSALDPAGRLFEGKGRSIGRSVRNGAAIGALGGLLIAPLIYSFCRTMEPGGTNCTGKVVLGFGIMTATGAAIGYLVGATDADPSVGGKPAP